MKALVIFFCVLLVSSHAYAADEHVCVYNDSELEKNHQIALSYEMDGNYDDAAKLYLIGAERGYVSSLGGLAFLFDGALIGGNALETLKWHTLAAKCGYAKSQSALSLSYIFGMENISKAEAYAWSYVAGLQGRKRAEEINKDLGEDMHPLELGKAKELAKEYYENYLKPFQ